MLLNIKNINKILLGASLVMLLFSCNKAWLDIKPDKKQVVPQTLNDLEALLQQNTILNTTSSSGLQTLAEEGTDNFFLTFSSWQGLSLQADKNAYIFAPKIFDGATVSWNRYYQRVFYANVALEGLAKITPNALQLQQWQVVKGSALFIRAHNFYWLLQIFAMPYNAAQAGVQPGIPLRLNANINEPTTRATVQQCYDRLLKDLKEAALLLPPAPQHKIKPSAAACYAMLARAYLELHNYDSAQYYATACLNNFAGQIQFSQAATNETYPLQNLQAEIIYTDKVQTGAISRNLAMIDTNLYKSYENGDLRKTIFFVKSSGTPYYNFRGSYEGVYHFGGIATDELLLTRAECYARKGDITKALADLDNLLKTRWDKNLYIPFTSNDKDQVLQKILLERRKQLCFRGLRWVDLRRLNQEGYNITVTRNLNGTIYQLLPNSPNYAFDIPDNVIELSGIEQNVRQ